MKPRSRFFLPRHLVLGAAPLLSCAAAHAAIINFNEHSTTNVWTFKPGVNLLATATVTPATAATHEGSSPNWATLTDGSVGAPAPTPATSVTPNNNTSVTYALDLSSNPAGYTITSFDSYAAWGDSGRDNQNFKIEYSTVSAPATFLTLATVNNQTGNPLRATHTSITDTSGILATNVHSVRLTFADQENGYVGYREFILRSEPSTITTLNESNITNLWTLPGGGNLLDGTTVTSPPPPATHGNSDITASSWAVLTNGTLGAPQNLLESAAPSNNTTVTFPLDLSVNTKGYEITSLDSYAAWPNSGRDNQDFSIRYSTVADPATFIPLASVSNRTSNDNSTHTRLTSSTGVLASGVAAIQYYFNSQENGYVGYREFIALGTAISVSDPLTWTGAGGSGGNASWIGGPDNNWKKTVGGAAAPFDPLAALTFTSPVTNRNITLPAALSAFSLKFTNEAGSPYTFGGQSLEVTNNIDLAGSGNATFNVPLLIHGDANVTGAGTLTFNNAIEASSVNVSGAGTLTLNSDNNIDGGASVTNGVLNLNSDLALGDGTLTVSGGTVNFRSTAPSLFSLSGSGGTIVLGNPTTPAATNLFVGYGGFTQFNGNITQAAGDVGSLTMIGSGSLTLGGTNTYTGKTTVYSGGALEFSKRSALYNADPASWTAAKLIVENNGILGLRVGGDGEFTDADFTLLDTGGFAPDSKLGINTASGDFTLTQSLAGAYGIRKSGRNSLILTAPSTYTGATQVVNGALRAANPGGTSLHGHIILGDGSADVFLNMAADNQFAPGSTITMTNQNGPVNAKFQLRGTSQTIAGLDSPTTSRVSLVQNDEAGTPGYTTDPPAATLTINATSDHSFAGLIRNQNGGAVSIVKNGPGTQEFINVPVQGYSYSGPTTVNEGTLKISFGGGNSGFGSNIAVAAPATLHFHAERGNFAFDRIISGEGKVLVDGSNAVILRNGSNTWSGGTTVGVGVNNGFLALDPITPTGQGTGPGQFCVAGAMIPSNVITVNPGATLSLDNTAALGNSMVVPEFAPSVHIMEGGRLFGGTNSVAFVSNLKLDGAVVEISGGAGTGGFNTNLAFVGTVVVGGAQPTTITTVATGPNANLSLGSLGLPGTTFQVADATGSPAADLVVSSVLRDVLNVASPLVKSGPGTMVIESVSTYTGGTTVNAGTLTLNAAYLANDAPVSIASGATLNLTHTQADAIGSLTLGGSAMPAGTYGSMTNSTPGVIQTPRITGPGTLVTSGPPSDPYQNWASVIPDAGSRGRTADPDGDGFNNLQEYLFGTSPVAANGSLTTVSRNGSNLVLRFNQRSGTGTYAVEESSTLAPGGWTTSSAVVTDATVQDLPDYVRKEATVPINSARKFLRVKATE